jgi:hypothetical protein
MVQAATRSSTRFTTSSSARAKNMPLLVRILENFWTPASTYSHDHVCCGCRTTSIDWVACQCPEHRVSIGSAAISRVGVEVPCCPTCTRLCCNVVQWCAVYCANMVLCHAVLCSLCIAVRTCDAVRHARKLKPGVCSLYKVVTFLCIAKYIKVDYRQHHEQCQLLLYDHSTTRAMARSALRQMVQQAFNKKGGGCMCSEPQVSAYVLLSLADALRTLHSYVSGPQFSKCTADTTAAAHLLLGTSCSGKYGGPMTPHAPLMGRLLSPEAAAP